MSLSISEIEPVLAADHGGEVAEVVGRERDVRVERLPHRLAVLPALGDGQHLEVLLDRVGDQVQHLRALGHRGLAPGVLGGVRRIERELDVSGAGLRHLGERLARRGREVRGVLAGERRDPLAPDEVLVPRLQLDRALGMAGRGVHRGFDGRHQFPLPCSW